MTRCPRGSDRGRAGIGTVEGPDKLPQCCMQVCVRTTAAAAISVARLQRKCPAYRVGGIWKWLKSKKKKNKKKIKRPQQDFCFFFGGVYRTARRALKVKSEMSTHCPVPTRWELWGRGGSIEAYSRTSLWFAAAILCRCLPFFGFSSSKRAT